MKASSMDMIVCRGQIQLRQKFEIDDLSVSINIRTEKRFIGR